MKTSQILRAARVYVAGAAEPQEGYGAWCGGDPRTFCPDCDNTPAQLAAHKAACEAADKADAEKRSPNVPCESGWISPHVHVVASSFGLGSYTYTDEAAVATLAEIDKAIHLAEQEEGSSK